MACLCSILTVGTYCLNNAEFGIRNAELNNATAPAKTNSRRCNAFFKKKRPLPKGERAARKRGEGIAVKNLKDKIKSQLKQKHLLQKM